MFPVSGAGICRGSEVAASTLCTRTHVRRAPRLAAVQADDRRRHFLQPDGLKLSSVLTCPRCGSSAEEQMPTDACTFFYPCTGCGALLRPEAGDCCVFCSYGTVPCPPVQRHGRCC